MNDIELALQTVEARESNDCSQSQAAVRPSRGGCAAVAALRPEQVELTLTVTKRTLGRAKSGRHESQLPEERWLVGCA